MDSSREALSDEAVFGELAGITGFGSPASFLGVLGSLAGYGNSLLSTVAMGPLSLLSPGIACFIAMLGLDRLRHTIVETDETGSSPS